MLTDAKIRALRPQKKRYTVTDRAGLGIEVMPTGLKVWRLRMDTITLEGREPGSKVACKVTIGRWPNTSISAARKTSKRLRESEYGLDRGRQEPAPAVPTVRAFGERYIQEVLERDRKNPAQLKRMLEREIWPAIGLRPIDQVEGAVLRDLIFRKRDSGRPAAAAAMRNLLKRMWDYAIVCGVATVNPAAATPLKFIGRAHSRSRTLSKWEVGNFLWTLYATEQIGLQQKLALHLLLLTMARKSELLTATWAEVDLGRGIWEIPAEHAKTGKAHIVYLSRQAVEILVEADETCLQGCIFPAANSTTQPMAAGTLNRSLARVKWGMPHFTIHDLRRTAATLLSEAGYPADVIEKALNHTIKGVRGVYNRAEYGEQRREMLQAWADMVDKWRAEA